MSINKDLLKFINEETNYYKGEMSISREKAGGKPTAYFTVKAGDVTLMGIWAKIDTTEKKPDDEKKHTGGKKPYTMIMTQKLTDLRDNKVIDYKELGCLAALTPNIQWGTGLVIDRKSKKPLTASKIAAELNMTPKVLRGLVKSLKDKQLLTVNKDGYFISTDLFKKGGKK